MLAYSYALGCLIYFSSPWAVARAATYQDVAFVGLLVGILLQNVITRREG